MHDSASIIYHQMVCFCRTGSNYSYFIIYPTKPSILSGYERVCHGYCFQGDTVHVLFAQPQDPLVVTVQLNPQCRNWRPMEDENWFNLFPVSFFFHFVFSIYLRALNLFHTMPKPVLYKVLLFTSVSFSIQKEHKAFFYMQHFTVLKHCCDICTFDLLSYILRHSSSTWSPKFSCVKYSVLRRPFSCHGISTFRSTGILTVTQIL